MYCRAILPGTLHELFLKSTAKLDYFVHNRKIEVRRFNFATFW